MKHKMPGEIEEMYGGKSQTIPKEVDIKSVFTSPSTDKEREFHSIFKKSTIKEESIKVSKSVWSLSIHHNFIYDIKVTIKSDKDIDSVSIYCGAINIISRQKKKESEFVYTFTFNVFDKKYPLCLYLHYRYNIACKFSGQSSKEFYESIQKSYRGKEFNLSNDLENFEMSINYNYYVNGELADIICGHGQKESYVFFYYLHNISPSLKFVRSLNDTEYYTPKSEFYICYSQYGSGPNLAVDVVSS